MRTLKLTASKCSKIRCWCEGAWYEFTVGKTLSVPATLASMLLAPAYPFGTFVEVAP
jgi:hypothetical protein